MLTTSRTFGVEIECQLPAGKNRDWLSAQIMAATRLNCFADHYSHNTTTYWKIVTDNSVGYGGCEVVSPILRGEEGIEQARKIVTAMLNAGCTIDNKCGLHVHVGTDGMTADAFRRVALNYIKFETFFDHIMPESRRASNNQYIKSNRAHFGDYSEASVARAFTAIKRAKTVADVIQTVNGSGDRCRYFKLNMTAWYRHKTIEFRQHSGTLNADKVGNWIALCVTFTDVAARTKPRVRTTTKTVTPGEEVTRFFKMFEMLKPVQTFYRQRLNGLKRTPSAAE